MRLHPRLLMSTGIPLSHSSFWTQCLSHLVYVTAEVVKLGSKKMENNRRRFPSKLSSLSSLGRANSTNFCNKYFQCDIFLNLKTMMFPFNINQMSFKTITSREREIEEEEKRNCASSPRFWLFPAEWFFICFH